jgi:hypothetical protein
MKKSLHFKGYVLAVCGVAIGGFATAQTVTISDTFSFTGGIQTFTVPCGVNSVFIDAYGAQGGTGADGNSNAGLTAGGAGGLGGQASGSFSVVEGDILNIFVGGQGAQPTGGFNGGANGGSQNAGGGGGASDVRFGGTGEANRILTAGGGGGGGRGGCESGTQITGGNGGDGGGGIGGDGVAAPTSGGNAGGGFGGNAGNVQGALGAAGQGCGGFLGSPGTTATTGVGGPGGSGQSCCCFSFASIPGGGGGGGGQLGGGGGGGGSAGTTGCSGNDKGAGGGGGGGSSFIGGVSNGTVINGLNFGNGLVVISYEDPTPVMAVIDNPTLNACEGDVLTYTCNVPANANAYTWTVSGGATIASGQGTNTVTVNTTGNFTIEVFGENTVCGLTGPTSTVTSVTVNPLPSVNLTSSNTGTFCGGEDVTLTGTPAGGTFTQTAGPANGLTGNIFNAPQVGNYTIEYSFTDGNGCANSTTIDFVVDCMLGLNTISGEGQVNVFPNPNNGQFVIKSDLTDKGQLELFTMAGQLVYSAEIDNLSEHEVEIKGLTPGVYRLSITSGDKKFVGNLNIVK